MRWLIVGLCPWIVFRSIEQNVFAQEPVAEEPLLFDVDTAAEAGQMDAVQEDDPPDRSNLDAAEFIGPPIKSVSEGPSARWQVHPHFDTRITYDDNIFIQPNNKKPDVSFAISPGLTVGYFDSPETSDYHLSRSNRASRLNPPTGSFLSADYTLTLLEFVHHSSENSVDHEFLLDGQWSDSKWRFGIHYRFLSGAGVDIDIGGRVNRQVQTVAMDARYDLSDKLFLESNFTRISSDPKGFVSAKENRLTSTINYSLTPLFSVGLGGAVGNLKVEHSPSESVEQILLRTRYMATEKLVFDATGGMEFRHTHDTNSRTTPVVDLGLSYIPFEGTEFTGNVFRRTENSALQGGNDYTLFGVNSRISHLLSRGIYLTLGAGYRQADYMDAPDGNSRSDKYIYIQPGILWNVNRWFNVQLLYMHGRNRSNDPQFEFSNNQVEIHASFIF
ncbi:MAG: hypothetical protein JWL59_4741 [Chthoniobacteraceae bacterium]|nr:hypothetical protein [Chthoniobacteraceae bacterium]